MVRIHTQKQQQDNKQHTQQTQQHITTTQTKQKQDNTVVHSKNEADRIKLLNLGIIERNPAEHEIHQAVQEFTGSVMPNAKYSLEKALKAFSSSKDE